MALMLALSGMAVLLTLGGALVTLTSTETAIAAGVREGVQTFYAAESGVAAAIRMLEAVPDWATVVNGATPLLARPFGELVAGAEVDTRLSVVVWVTDDPIEDPATLVVRSHAYGPRGAHRVIETTVRRSGQDVGVLDWREWR
jgi:hypothetical protein